MALPEVLVECYSAITCGPVLLGLDGFDFFPRGGEPKLRRVPAYDAPDCAGRADGELYARGNLRWSLSFTRVRRFDLMTYPVMTEGEDPEVYAANPQQHAQRWLADHFMALPDETAALTWEDVRSWPTAVVEADGETDCGWAVVNYTLTMTNAS